MRRLSGHRVVRNALVLYGSQAANNILPWITYPYLTRTLGPDMWGLVTWAQEFIRYFTVITAFGFDLSATRQVAIHRDDPEKLSRIFSAVMIARGLLMAASFVIMVFIIEVTPVMRPHLALFLITFLNVVTTAIFPQWLFQGIEKMGVVTAREIGARLVGLLPTFILVHGPQDYLLAAAVQTGSGVVSALAGLMMMGTYTTARFRLVSWAEVLEQYRDSSHIFLSMVAINLYGSSNRFILGFLSGDRGVGIFNPAQRIIDAARSLAVVLGLALFPHVSNLVATGRSQILAIIRRCERHFLIPFGAVSLGLLFLSSPVIRLIGGHAYIAAIPLLRIMSATPLIAAYSMLYTTLFMLALGYKKEWARFMIEGAVVNFIVLLALLPFLDPGKSVATTAIFVDLWILLRSWLFYRSHRAAAAVDSPSLSQ
jgi:PST family polysaccharide transporter